MMNDFVALILTHGRADKVFTYKTLRDCGYSGPIRLVVDNLDKQLNKYKEKYGSELIVFDKAKVSESCDYMDNRKDYRAIIAARNISFEITKKLGFKYFIQLDDDYTRFDHRFNQSLEYISSGKKIKNLDKVFSSMVEFFEKSNCLSLALAQGGDYIGGAECANAQKPTAKRKVMNSFICSVDRPFSFKGRMNDDVTTYTTEGSRGKLFMQTSQVSLEQKPTQKIAGGMTELYKDAGTYVKSFYSVMSHPSSITIKMLSTNNPRLHHSVKWNDTVPKIVSEKLKK